MGAGIARAIKARYPEAYRADCTTIQGDRGKLGTYTSAQYPDRLIFNLYTQYKYGQDKLHLDYEALVNALHLMKDYLDEHDPNQHEIVGLPRIGCGLAGGEWKLVEELIADVFFDRTVHVYTL